MKRLRLVRVAEHSNATFGVLTVNDVPEFVTVEDLWRSNERMVSCIPVGTYSVRPKDSPKFGTTWQVMDVPGRDYILFHAGNTHRDTNGCILVGMQFGKMKDESAILGSRTAFANFLRLMRDIPEAKLEVVDARGK